MPCISRYLLLAALVVIGGLTESRAAATPSKELQAALAQRLDALPGRSHPMSLVASRAFHAAQAMGVQVVDKIAVEYEGKTRPAKLEAEIPAGTLVEQLDIIAERAGYVWEANGDWINFIPKAKANDPNYIMNQRIPGKVVVSRDPAKETNVKAWFAERRIHCSREYRGLHVTGVARVYGADPIILDNPRLRDYANARETLFGNDRSSDCIEVKPHPDGKSRPYISLVSSSQNTRALIEAQPTARPAPAAEP